MSVYKLVRDNHLIVSFDENNCHIQDLTTKKNLVTDRQLDGLYLCDAVNFVQVFLVVMSQ